jgi:tRNA (guanine37-N1)-methyltransferase
MKIDILSLFPEMFSPLDVSIIKRARDKGIIDINIHNIRDFSADKHKKVDDYPYGGGSGMVMAAEPIYNTIEYILKTCVNKPRILLMAPGGKIFNQDVAKELSCEENLIFVCGHYEGIDERIKPIIDDELSVGDFVLTGGELASMIIIDATCRMLPGVLSSNLSYEEESFYDGLLEYPQYTRPEVFRGMGVPQILLSGHHENVRKWRRYQSIKKTLKLRPELIDCNKLSIEDKKLIKKIESGDEII